MSRLRTLASTAGPPTSNCSPTAASAPLPASRARPTATTSSRTCAWPTAAVVDPGRARLRRPARSARPSTLDRPRGRAARHDHDRRGLRARPRERGREGLPHGRQGAPRRRRTATPRAPASSPVRSTARHCLSTSTSSSRTCSRPAESKAEFAKRGWKTVVGFQTRNPIHRAHEYITKVGAGEGRRALPAPAGGRDEERRHRRRDADEVLRSADRGLLRQGARRAGRQPGRHALRRPARGDAATRSSRQNYGCTHFIVGRDHAGVGSYYGTYDAQGIFDEFGAGELASSRCTSSTPSGATSPAGWPRRRRRRRRPEERGSSCRAPRCARCSTAVRSRRWSSRVPRSRRS